MTMLHDGLISDKEVARRIGKHKSTVWRYVKKYADFPRPIKLSEGDTKFNEALLDVWIKNRREAVGLHTSVAEAAQ